MSDWLIRKEERHSVKDLIWVFLLSLQRSFFLLCFCGSTEILNYANDLECTICSVVPKAKQWGIDISRYGDNLWLDSPDAKSDNPIRHRTGSVKTKTLTVQSQTGAQQHLRQTAVYIPVPFLFSQCVLLWIILCCGCAACLYCSQVLQRWYLAGLPTTPENFSRNRFLLTGSKAQRDEWL